MSDPFDNAVEAAAKAHAHDCYASESWEATPERNQEASRDTARRMLVAAYPHLEEERWREIYDFLGGFFHMRLKTYKRENMDKGEQS